MANDDVKSIIKALKACSTGMNCMRCPMPKTMDCSSKMMQMAASLLQDDRVQVVSETKFVYSDKTAQSLKKELDEQKLKVGNLKDKITRMNENYGNQISRLEDMLINGVMPCCENCGTRYGKNGEKCCEQCLGSLLHWHLNRKE